MFIVMFMFMVMLAYGALVLFAVEQTLLLHDFSQQRARTTHVCDGSQSTSRRPVVVYGKCKEPVGNGGGEAAGNCCWPGGVCKVVWNQTSPSRHLG